MDREKYFAELYRILANEGIETTPAKNGRLPVLLNGQPAFRVEAPGFLCKAPGDLNTPEANDLYDRTAPIADMVREYMTAMELAPILHAKSLDEDYRLLADFNGYVLAGLEMEKNYGYKFVTWERDYDRTGVGLGHYFINKYTSAKEDFAVRSGLIPEKKLFSPEQFSEMYKCIKGMLEGGYELTYDSEKKLGEIREQIECIVPDVEERIAQAQGQAPQMNM
ncbi:MULTISPECIES: hypothetical protein [unclassified Dehalobacter]|jgi:hypothetical protein|uniref:hypothetical protein n=1 Tax=unclassified Dehalobacter TaxID=2635733 RepID=UPI000E6C7BAD|nr:MULTISPECIES: hypothetical protein [unclassified Dehalobacter]RJE46585.1 hypothetical protein A7K50_12525 [Dehalobacter sp. MCB1]TCX47353.1 hypothetical protein C1I36_13685 [Dehalobacter sp. 14DCB1]TCX55566.1 hypothetical protein C1I38_02650 [Dehalobacter sp. 12DCB1]